MTITDHDRRDDGRLTQLTARARELAAEVPGPLRRVSVRIDGAAVELEWDEPTPAANGHPPVPALAAVPDSPSRAGTGAGIPGDTNGTGGADAPDATSDADGAELVRSPVVGTFYSAPAPGEAPFVTVGGSVEPDTVIGIVEAMKLMNHIVAGCRGRVRSVLCADGDAIEFDQPLVVVDTESADREGSGS